MVAVFHTVYDCGVCSEAVRLMAAYRECVAAHGKAVQLLSDVMADKAAFTKALAASQAASQACKKALDELKKHRQQHDC